MKILLSFISSEGGLQLSDVKKRVNFHIHLSCTYKNCHRYGQHPFSARTLSIAPFFFCLNALIFPPFGLV